MSRHTDRYRLFDPELAAIVRDLPSTPMRLETLATTRANVTAAVAAVKAATPPYPAIEVTEHHVAASGEAPPVRVLVYRPRAAIGPLAALLWIHGGGFVAGSPEWDDGLMKQLVDTAGCLVVSVDYRLAPETAHPGPLEDCYAALAWLHGEAGSLAVDVGRIGIGGLSAGGGLCACLALLARDRGEIALCMQAPMQPMLDDRTALLPPSADDPRYIWGRADNHEGWSALLGHAPGGAGVPEYAAAARAADLRGLPPTLIGVGALDLFALEDIDYARRLIEAGVPTELHVYPGACHAFQMLAPQAQVAQDYQADFFAAVRRGLASKSSASADHNLAFEADAALLAHLQQALPGLPSQDLASFARSLSIPDPYPLGEESLPREDAPRGRLTSGVCPPGALYPGVAHDYTVYVPAQYDAGTPAALLVCMDGARYTGPEINVPVVLDNLIDAGVVPPTVAVFVQPGASGPGLPVYGGSDNRSIEYDSLGDAYVRFLLEELLPAAIGDLTISADPAGRIICGLSSGGMCAFNAAWERPEAFGKVITHCGSFVAIRGGHTMASTVRSSAARPLEVFLQTGDNDLDILFGNWRRANQEMAAALAYRGYRHQLVIGKGGHSLKHGGAMFPDTLRWLWQSMPASALNPDKESP